MRITATILALVLSGVSYAVMAEVSVDSRLARIEQQLAQQQRIIEAQQQQIQQQQMAISRQRRLLEQFGLDDDANSVAANSSHAPALLLDDM